MSCQYSHVLQQKCAPQECQGTSAQGIDCLWGSATFRVKAGPQAVEASEAPSKSLARVVLPGRTVAQTARTSGPHAGKLGGQPVYQKHRQVQGEGCQEEWTRPSPPRLAQSGWQQRAPRRLCRCWCCPLISALLPQLAALVRPADFVGLPQLPWRPTR